MNKLFSILIITSVLLLSFSDVSKGQTKFRPDATSYQYANKLLAKMSLDDKIGQLVHIGINGEYYHHRSHEYLRIKRQIVENKVGGVLFFAGGIYNTVHFVNRMQENSKIPLLVSADFETGVGMRMYEAINLPWNMAIAATQNPYFARRAGEITALEARAIGVQQVYAPVVDVNNNAKNPVINVRSFGENPNDVAKFGVAFANGLQSGNVLATAKHFPGHGDTDVDSHRGLPVVDFSRERLEKTEFLPFRELIKNGVGSVMISHISMPQLDSETVTPIKNSLKSRFVESEVVTENTTIPATLSKNIVTNILKKDMGFDGLIVTDAMDMSGLTLYFDQEESAVRAILAGNDILLKPANSDAIISGIKKAVLSGRITEKRIDESARKILAWKHKLRLFNRKTTPIGEIDKAVAGSEIKKLADNISRNAITLVKNEDKILPLKQNQKAVVICITNGPDFDTTGQTFVNGLEANGMSIERIALDKRSNETEIKNAIGRTKQADIVLVGLFGRVQSGAENSVGIPKSGEKVLRELLKSDIKTISIAFGNPYLILDFPQMNNYIVSYGDMDSLQSATSDALVGKIDFKGKLPITVGKYKRGLGLNLD